MESKHVATSQSDESPSPQPKARFLSHSSHTSQLKSLFLFQSLSEWERNISCYYRSALVQTELPPGWLTNQHDPEVILSVLSTCSRVWLSEGVIFSLLCQNKEEKQSRESDYSQITLRTTQKQRLGDCEGRPSLSRRSLFDSVHGGISFLCFFTRWRDREKVWPRLGDTSSSIIAINHVRKRQQTLKSASR